MRKPKKKDVIACKSLWRRTQDTVLVTRVSAISLRPCLPVVACSAAIKWDVAIKATDCCSCSSCKHLQFQRLFYRRGKNRNGPLLDDADSTTVLRLNTVFPPCGSISVLRKRSFSAAVIGSCIWMDSSAVNFWADFVFVPHCSILCFCTLHS